MALSIQLWPLKGKNRTSFPITRFECQHFNSYFVFVGSHYLFPCFLETIKNPIRWCRRQRVEIHCPTKELKSHHERSINVPFVHKFLWCCIQEFKIMPFINNINPTSWIGTQMWPNTSKWGWCRQGTKLWFNS